VAESNEVRTRLILEDETSGPLDKVEQGLDDVTSAEDKAESGFASFAATASHTATALGVNLREVVGKFEEWGKELINVGAAAESGDNAVAALIQNAQGKKFDEALGMAEELGDRLDEIAIKAGISGDAVGDAFQVILEKTGASEQGVKSATDQLAKMSTIAGVLDKDVGGIAQEFAFMQEGQLKVKGQLFQLLQGTGVFGDNVKKAVASWATLTEEKRAAILSDGLSRLAGTMDKMPPTFKQAEAGLENMIRLAKEDIGQPLIEELTPAVDELSNTLVELGPDIRDFGKAMAKDVGAAVRAGAKDLKEAVGWLREHKDEIAQGFREGAEKVKEVVSFILEHKEEIALAFGAKAAMPIIKPVASGVTDVAKAGYGGAGGGVLGVGEKGIAGATTSLAAFTAAIVSVGIAADQAAKLAAEVADAEDTRLGGMKKLAELADKGDVEQVKNVVESMRQIDDASGKLTPQMKLFYDTVLRNAESARDAQEAEQDRLKAQIDMGRRGAADLDATAGGKFSADTQGQIDQGARNQAALLVNAYNQAITSNNDKMALLAAQTLAASGLVGKALLDSSQQIQGGFEGMAEVLSAGGADFKDFADKLKAKGAGGTAKAPTINFNGGQSIKLVQNFRDQDPDRVAIMSMKGFGKAAMRQVQSRLTSPFGG